MSKAADLEIAWAAGFFEGEGYFTSTVANLKSGQQRRYPMVGINNTDHPMLVRFHAIVGVGRISSRSVTYSPFNAKPQWMWRACKRSEVEYVLDLFRPWLSERRLEQAAAVLDELGKLNGPKSHCPRGHAYSEENTYVWGKYRWCRTCRAEKRAA